MCFYISDRYIGVRVAEKDIECLKVLKVQKKLFRKRYKSLVYDYEYFKGRDCPRVEIHEGVGFCYHVQQLLPLFHILHFLTLQFGYPYLAVQGLHAIGVQPDRQRIFRLCAAACRSKAQTVFGGTSALQTENKSGQISVTATYGILHVHRHRPNAIQGVFPAHNAAHIA